jgi:hypothetical protein
MKDRKMAFDILLRIIFLSFIFLSSESFFMESLRYANRIKRKRPSPDGTAPCILFSGDAG